MTPVPTARFGLPYGGVQMRGFVWLALGVVLFLAWGISCLVFHVAGVLIHVLLVFALISLMIYVFIEKRAVE
jgi:hypothetical protein